MPAHDPKRQQLVTQIASLCAWHPDDPQLPVLRAELATMRLTDTITKTMTKVVLSPDQRDRLIRTLKANQ